MRPDRHFQTLAVHDPRCTHRWKQDQTASAKPRQDHAHFGHPAAIVLAVTDGVHDLEVAFQSDDDKTKLTGDHANCRQTYSLEQNADCAVDDRIAVVVIGVRKRQGDCARSCLLYTSPSPRDGLLSRMPSSA